MAKTNKTELPPIGYRIKVGMFRDDVIIKANWFRDRYMKIKFKRHFVIRLFGKALIDIPIDDTRVMYLYSTEKGRQLYVAKGKKSGNT